MGNVLAEQYFERIQPHGMLMALTAENPYYLLQASDNAPHFFDSPLSDMLGKPLVNILDETAFTQFSQLLEPISDALTVSGPIQIRFQQEPRHYHSKVFLNHNYLLLELWPESPQPSDHVAIKQLQEIHFGFNNLIERDHNAPDCYGHLADHIGTVTGFHRVQVIKLDRHGHGEVIAESLQASADSYLGMHFPACDMALLREGLSLDHPLSYQQNIHASPAVMCLDLSSMDDIVPDLSRVGLRHFSPVQIEYFKGQGAAAVLRILLQQNGKIWGLVVCQHFQEKPLNIPVRDALTYLCQMVSAKLSVVELQYQSRLVNQSVHIVAKFIKHINFEQEDSLLQFIMPELMQIMQASGILVVVEGRLYQHGITPKRHEADDLLAWLSEQSNAVSLCSDQLNSLFQPIPESALAGAGILATPLSADMKNTVIWLKPETVIHKQWLAKPNSQWLQLPETAGQLSADTALLSWTEICRGGSEAWTDIQQSVGSDLAAVVTEGLSGKIQLQQALQRQNQMDQDFRITATAFDAQEGILLTDVHLNIVRVNQAFVKMTGYATEELCGKQPKILQSGCHDNFFYREMWDHLNFNGVWDGEIWNKHKNGQIFPVHLTITTVKNPDGEIINYVGAYIAVPNNTSALEEIERLAYFDPLTCLPNRRLLVNRMKRAVSASARNGKFGALLFIDLDNFKSLNDTQGHDMGDLLLQQVAQRLASCVREGDTVARLGGDEFVVLLEELSEQRMEAAALCEIIVTKIMGSLNNPYRLGGYTNYYTPSVGVTLFSEHLTDIEELLKQADIAMYQAKKAGRNTFCFFDPQMQAAILARASLESELRLALPKQQLQLHYQLQTTADQKIIGAEALLRWRHADGNLVYPLDFIPLAEESNLILKIGLWVLDNACRQLRAWQDSPATRELVLSVNISPKQIKSQDFVNQVLHAVNRHGVNPARLRLELTESILLDNSEIVICKIAALNEFGIRFALDNFGTGYSSIKHLKRLPLEQLKIHRSFVKTLEFDNEEDLSVIRTIIAMANSLGIAVVAEGVETESQRSFLEQHGCLNYQGFLFGKPVGAEDFMKLLAGINKPDGSLD